MNLVLATIVAAGVDVSGGLTTNYVQEIRAEIALADHLVVRLSSEKGAAARSVKELADLREIAKQIPRSVAALPSEGNVSSADYATIAVYSQAKGDKPGYEITVMPSLCAFRVKGRVYELKLPDNSLYEAVVRAARKQH